MSIQMPGLFFAPSFRGGRARVDLQMKSPAAGIGVEE
jgi:hypothetical protein